MAHPPLLKKSRVRPIKVKKLPKAPREKEIIKGSSKAEKKARILNEMKISKKPEVSRDAEDALLIDIAHILPITNKDRIQTARKLLTGIKKAYPDLIKKPEYLLEILRELKGKGQLSIYGLNIFFQNNEGIDDYINGSKNNKGPFVQIIYTPMGSDS